MDMKLGLTTKAVTQFETVFFMPHTQIRLRTDINLHMGLIYD